MFRSLPRIQHCQFLLHCKDSCLITLCFKAPSHHITGIGSCDFIPGLQFPEVCISLPRSIARDASQRLEQTSHLLESHRMVEELLLILVSRHQLSLGLCPHRVIIILDLTEKSRVLWHLHHGLVLKCSLIFIRLVLKWSGQGHAGSTLKFNNQLVFQYIIGTLRFLAVVLSGELGIYTGLVSQERHLVHR